jgi:hypothetical protein
VTISARGSAGITLRPLTRRVRQVWTVLHVVSSMGWLGVELSMLALLLSGAYAPAAMLADTMLMPASVLTVLTGVVLGMGTKWGLAKYYWVFVKLVIGLLLFVASAFTLNDNLRTAADAGRLDGGDAVSLAGMMSVLGLLGLTAAVLSITKPWGRITWRRTPIRAQETSS